LGGSEDIAQTGRARLQGGVYRDSDCRCEVLAELPREAIDCDRFALSPRVRSFKAILAKLDPPAPRSEPLAPPKPPGEPSLALRKRRPQRIG
jgi:hypothetical protein